MGCVLWSLWYERNEIKFEQTSPDFNRFAYSLKISISVWAKELLGYSDFSPQVFANNLDAFIS